MPLAEAPMAVLATALRDPNVVIRYQAKIVTVPGSDCLWWQGVVSGRGHVGGVERGPGAGPRLRQSLVSADRPWPRQAVLARAEPPRLPGAAVLGGQPVGGCPAYPFHCRVSASSVDLVETRRRAPWPVLWRLGEAGWS